MTHLSRQVEYHNNHKYCWTCRIKYHNNHNHCCKCKREYNITHDCNKTSNQDIFIENINNIISKYINLNYDICRFILLSSSISTSSGIGKYVMNFDELDINTNNLTSTQFDFSETDEFNIDNFNEDDDFIIIFNIQTYCVLHSTKYWHYMHYAITHYEIIEQIRNEIKVLKNDN
jgi:hypothetical protein